MTSNVIHVVTVPPPMTEAERADGVTAPANYKDPAKIAEYVRDNAERKWLQLALDPWRAVPVLVVALWEGAGEPFFYDPRKPLELGNLAAGIAAEGAYAWGSLGTWSLLAQGLRSGAGGALTSATVEPAMVVDVQAALTVRGAFDRSVPSMQTMCGILGIPAPPAMDAETIGSALLAKGNADPIVDRSLAQARALRSGVERLLAARVLR